MIKRFLIWFLKQIGNQPSDYGDAWNYSILCRGFLQPIIDNGEMYAKWLENYNKRCTAHEQFLDQTICPHIGRSCSKGSCTAYREGYHQKVLHDVPFTEQLIARIEGRKPKECYMAHCDLSSCSKKVF